MDTPFGTATVSFKAHREANRRRPWLMAADVAKVEGNGGPFIDVVDENALPLGTALFCPHEEVRLRLFSSARTRDPLSLMRTRLERAEKRRRADLMGADAYRLCHAEADGMPRLFIDRFGEGLFATSVCEATDAIFDALLPLLVDVTGAQKVVHWRQDPATGAFVGTRKHGDDAMVRFHHGRLLMSLDLASSFELFGLTARLSAQRSIRRFARGRVLDVDASDGGFGLQLADAGARSVLAVEPERELVSSLLSDIDQNGLADKIDVECADGTERMRELGDTNERFDVVVLHPLRQSAVMNKDDARQAVFERHRAAMRLLSEGRLLITWPQAAPLSELEFAEVVADAAHMGQQRLQVVARLDAGPDHPGLLGVPESRPQATWVCRVLSTS